MYRPADRQRPLGEEAHRRGRPQAALVREALRSYLEGRVRPQPRSLGLGEDTGVAARDSEAWLAREWGRR